MSVVKYVREALRPLATYGEQNGRVSVLTQCLYPSNSAVTVYVMRGAEGATVTDDGGAIHEITTHNRAVSDPDKFLARFCRQSGLIAEAGAIRSPVVEIRQLPASVMFVANASAAAAHWGMDHFKLRKRRELEEVLERTFPPARIERERRLLGKSSAPISV